MSGNNTSDSRTVFISYAREDEQLILPVAHLLRAAGAVVFFDIEDISYGEKWESVLIDKLRASERILVFWSSNAVNSEWVRREYLTAIGAGLRIIPVPLDATPLPAELAMYQALTVLAPLVYQAQRQNVVSRGNWKSLRPRGSWYGLLLVMALVGATMSALRSFPSTAEGSESSPLLSPNVWVVGVLALILFFGLGSIYKTPQEERQGQYCEDIQEEWKDLREAIYDAVFNTSTNARYNFLS